MPSTIPNLPKGYVGLDFSFATFLSELEHLYSLAEEFLTADAQWRWKSWVEALEGFQSSKMTQKWDWQTSYAIETIPAREYESNDGKCAFEVHGRMSSIWTLALAERTKRPLTFRMLGKASTALSIVEGKAGENGKILAQWQIEVGDAASPGCHFHIGVGQQAAEGLFPKGLCVPRLPCFLVTPSDGLDFLLGELFQTRWREKVGEDSTAAKSFGSPQRTRFERLLTWKLSTVKKASGSAWNHLKGSRPEEPAFLLA